MVVESDGSLYPCDFFAVEKYRLGSLQDMSISEALDSLASSEFIKKSRVRPAECAGCMYFAACRGGCARDMVTGSGGPQNYYCSAFKEFFGYAYPRLLEMAASEAYFAKETSFPRDLI
jgi:uncharacterized protein